MMIVKDYFVENYADCQFYDEIILQQRKYKWSIPDWPHIPDYTYRILIIGGSGSGKTNDIDKIYLYEKDPYKAKY